MKRKIVSGLVLSTLLVSILALASNTHSVNTWENGTIYIRADGSIEPSDAPISVDGNVYALTDNIQINIRDADGIIIERDNVIIDGAGHSIEGVGVGENGINIADLKGVTIRNITIKTFNINIHLFRSSQCNISQTDIRIAFEDGIRLSDNSYNNTISDNIISSNGYGIIFSEPSGSIHSSDYNTISGNIVSNNNVGIAILWSSDNRICGNNITNNEDGILISRVFSDHNTIADNTVSNNDYGITLADDSNRNTISGNIVSNNNYGIDLIGSQNNNISDNTIINSNGHGINLYDSKGNTISGSTITSNDLDGIHIQYSDSNTISGNTITSNNDYGIYTHSSDYNTISGNIVSNNNHGIGLADWPSNNNMISDNTISNNSGEGIFLYYSSNNTISNNTASNNQYGINVYSSHYNTISGNTITSNDDFGIYLRADNNAIYGNTIEYNNRGVWISLSSEYSVSGNWIHHNNLFINVFQAQQNGLNFWDDGSEGNYWSDYEGVDLDSDGIGDTEIPHYGDRYPFIIPLGGSIPVFHKETRYDCIIDGSMTVSRISLTEDKTISFNINGEGYVNLTIPSNLIDGSMKVFVDYTQKPCLLSWNRTYNSIYFEHATSVPLNVKIEAKFKLFGDLNNDGIVNILDIAAVAVNFGQTVD